MGASTGRTVLILGDSRGIGAAIVHRFVTDGANVRFTYVGSKDTARRLAQEAGATAVFADSAGRDAVINVVRKSGTLDILVVNAGISVFGGALELNVDDIGCLFKISIHAPYYASVEVARQMPEGGHILIIGSMDDDHMPVAGMATYAANKSALQGMTRGLARDFRPHGITVNIAQPGPIDTDANPASGPMRDMSHSLMTIKRHGQPREVTGIVVRSAEPGASSVIGMMHTIDGASDA